MENKQTIAILVASDNYYSVLIAALLKSIDVNHKTEEHIDFYIIDDNISEKNKRNLEQVVSKERLTIIWISKNQLIPEGMHVPHDNSRFPPTIYYRIFAPYVIDQNLDKLIYIDVDTIVRADISKLWHVEMSDYILAAVLNIGKTVTSRWGGIPNYAQLGLSSDTKYFNSGVLLINPKKWRAHDISKKIIDILIENKKYVVLPDQYGLNVMFANNWLELDERWNWSAAAPHEHPFLVHFLHIKPIYESCYAKEAWKSEFFFYLNQTPWAGFKLISENRRRLRLGYNLAKKHVLRIVKIGF